MKFRREATEHGALRSVTILEESSYQPTHATRPFTPMTPHSHTASPPLLASRNQDHASSVTPCQLHSIMPPPHRTRLLHSLLPSAPDTKTPLPHPAPSLTYRHVRGAQVLDRALQVLVDKERAQVLHAGRGRGGGRRLLHRL